MLTETLVLNRFIPHLMGSKLPTSSLREEKREMREFPH
ncbi:hypothetical protein BAOM_1812 [Peribacillus asahii]|uniref:Uncharacterized protein n=1 Tax=Peribacillus asahii TaxID=228899 RepID=A0A3Q9RMT6_9BACI|nr:hypothetical protein BAOM_1812 [Peribacillus asahii]